MHRWRTLSDRALNAVVLVALTGLAVLVVLPALLPLAAGVVDTESVRAVLGTTRLRVLLGRSVVVIGVAIATGVGIGTPLGILLGRFDLPGRRALLGLALFALCLPPYVHGACWLGVVGTSLWAALPTDPWWPRALIAGAVEGITWLPLAVLAVAAAVRAVAPDQEDLARLDGGRWVVLRAVVWPAAQWGAGVAAAAILMLALTDMTVTDILLVRTFAEEAFTQFVLTRRPGSAAVLALPAMALAVLALLVLARRLRHLELGEPTTGPVKPLALGRWRWPAAVLAWLPAAAFGVVPLAGLVRSLGSPRALLTTQLPNVAGDILYTLPLALATAVLAAVLALVLGHILLRPGVGRWLIAGALLLLLATPAPVVGAGVIALLNHRGPAGWLYDSPAVLVLTYLCRVLPFAVLVLLPMLHRVPRELDDAAALEGADWLRRRWLVDLPLAWRGLLVAGFLAFALAITEVGASFLVAPPGRTTVGIRFFTLIHFGLYPDAALLCLSILLFVGLAAAAVMALLSPARRVR